MRAHILFQKDRERATYGFKEAALAKAFISSFGLNEKSKDAQSLINWKKPGDEGVSLFPVILLCGAADVTACRKPLVTSRLSCIRQLARGPL